MTNKSEILPAGGTIALADEILIKILAAGDAAWLPKRAEFVFRLEFGGNRWRAQRDFIQAGSPWRSGAGSTTEAKQAERALKALKKDGLVRIQAPARVKTMFVSLTDSGEMYARRLCGAAGELASWWLGREIAQHSRPDPKIFQHAWVCELDLMVPGDELLVGNTYQEEVVTIENMSLWGTRRRLIDTRCNGHAHYGLTPAGWEWIESDEPPDLDCEPDPAAAEIYYDRRNEVGYGLRTNKWPGPLEIGEFPLPGGPLNIDIAEISRPGSIWA